jgi:hypothetical protein
MKKSSQIAWKLVPLRHFFPLKVVPLIGVLLYPAKSLQKIWGNPLRVGVHGRIGRLRKNKYIYKNVAYSIFDGLRSFSPYYVAPKTLAFDKLCLLHNNNKLTLIDERTRI